MRVTIKDIAKATGVSSSTVSLVLNGKDHRISEKTRRLVIRTANAMNYQPNQLAVGLITRRTNTIGVVIPDVSNGFFSELVKGAEHAACASGYNIILCNTDDRAERDNEALRLLLGRDVDGVALVLSSESTGKLGKECLQLLSMAQKPVVLMDRSFVGQKISSVMVDHMQGGYTATRYLIQNGHVYIGCITGPIRLHTALMRYNGYRSAMQESGLPLDADLVAHGDYRFEDGERYGRRLIEKGATAIFACNDMMAYGVLKAASSMGLSVPEDVSVIGFDNIPFSELTNPPLTTMNQHAIRIGEMAMEKLIRLIRSDSEPQEGVRLTPELVVRRSVKRKVE